MSNVFLQALYLQENHQEKEKHKNVKEGRTQNADRRYRSGESNVGAGEL
jgi:hypothetical protein